MDATGLAAVLGAVRVTEADLRPEGNPYLGPPAPAWFDWHGRTLVMADGWTGSLAHVTVAVAPDPEAPGRWIIFLWGFQA